MKLFECIIDDGKSIFKTTTAAKNRKELLEVCGGNGTFEKIKDVTASTFPGDPDDYVENLRSDLYAAGWSRGQGELVCALLHEHFTGRRRKSEPEEEALE